jgi:succinate dehydrogenase / fumarate reductase flavoprotein subunit
MNPMVPDGPIETAWEQHRAALRLVSPNNRRKRTVIVVGTGLAGGSAAATLGELGYNVISFCYQDSPRRAHSVAAQGGINAAKNYRGDGDSVRRLFVDTIKGGDYRSRESNVYRLAELSANIIDQAVAQGVPFAREYGGLLDTRSFGGAQVARTFYARGQTGQQLLLGAYQALERQIAAGRVTMHPRTEMLDLIVHDGRARGIVVRDLVTGRISSHTADAVVLATGGYGNAYYLSTNAKGCNATAIWRAHRRGALFANPCFTQIHPTCIPVSGAHQSKLTLMSESLRNDGRMWVPSADGGRDYFLERMYPSYGNLVPRDIASRAVKLVCDAGNGVGPGGQGVYLDFDGIPRSTLESRYGNIFEMYERITGEDPYTTPMRIYPAVHYTMGGLWVDYDLMTTIPGLFAIGEANFSDHGANRLGASALMQGLADGYFVLPATVANYLADAPFGPVSDDSVGSVESDVDHRTRALLGRRRGRTVDDFHRELGRLLWDECGMTRSEPGLKAALDRIPALRDEYRESVVVTGGPDTLNQALERAGRVADFLELAELMCLDALHRDESCGAHYRVERGESRDDDTFAYVAAWEHTGGAPVLHKEQLTFTAVTPSARSYA